MDNRLLLPRTEVGGFTPASLPDLIAWWKFDEEATTTNVAAIDSINAYNLSAVSGPMATTGRNGRARRSRVGTNLFNAPAGQAVFTRALSGSTPAVAQDRSMTFAVWFYPEYSLNSGGTSSTPLFFNFQGTTQGSQVRMAAGSIPAYNTPMSARAYYTDGTFTSVIASTAINTAIPQGAWSHLACVISREASTVRLFINGSQVASAALAAGKTLDGIASNCAVVGFSAPGLVDDAVLYSRALSGAEITKLATAPAVPTTNASLHLEAEVWVGRVIGNGGSVSATTAQAVSDFCTAIDAAGIRDRFYRLNLFCGNNLPAALVPLYRGQSVSGTQFGNTTDFNNGPFVSGDYAETGSTAGLKSDGSTKYLNTGFKAPAASLSATGFHLSCYVQGVEAGGSSRIFIGNATNRVGINLTTAIGWVTSGAVSSGVIADTSFPDGGSTDRQGLLLAATNGSRESTYYNDATPVVSQTSTQVDFETGTGDEFTIAARNFVGAIQLYSLNKRFRAYSLGAGMSASQVAAFNTAMQAFQAALGRNL
jgi:hypothetical protein